MSSKFLLGAYKVKDAHVNIGPAHGWPKSVLSLLYKVPPFRPVYWRYSPIPDTLKASLIIHHFIRPSHISSSSMGVPLIKVPPTLYRHPSYLDSRHNVIATLGHIVVNLIVEIVLIFFYWYYSIRVGIIRKKWILYDFSL